MKKSSKRDITKAAAAVVASPNGHIELTIFELIGMTAALEPLIQKPLPARSSFRLAQLINAINPHIQAFDATKRKLFTEMGEPDVEDGNTFRIPDDKIALFTEQFNEMGAEKVSVPAFKILLPDTLEVEAQYLIPIEQFIEMAPEEE